MSTSPLTPENALSIIRVPFHGDEFQALRTPDGKVWVLLRRCCESLGIDADGQRRRLSDKQRSPWACTAVMAVHDASGRPQEAYLIDLDSLPMWLATVSPKRVRPGLRAKLADYQREAAGVLRDHFLSKPRPAQYVVTGTDEDPLLIAIEHTRQLRLAQIETERRLAEVRRLTLQAHEEAPSAGRRADAALRSVTNQHGYYTALAWLKLQGREVTLPEACRYGKQLSAICRDAGLRIGEARDTRFGKVGSYPESVLAEFFGPVEE